MKSARMVENSVSRNIQKLSFTVVKGLKSYSMKPFQVMGKYPELNSDTKKKISTL